jgi:folate-binding protein YgfZ
VTEADRIAAGRARFPVDLTGRSLPNEAGLERLIDVEKGCFLGQEAVAKVRTLGHPTHVVLSVEADGLLEAGEEVLADGEPAGVVTGAAAGDEGRAAGIVRVRWAARDGHLETERGTALAVRGLARGPA